MPSLSDPQSAREAEPPAPTLEHLYRHHAQWLGDVMARRFGRQLCAEELVQETYARLARSPLGDLIAHPRALLWRIANRIALDQLRQRRRAEQARRNAPVCQTSDADQAESVLLAELMAALPRNCRDTFLLCRFSGLTHAQVAERQGVSIKTVEWRMSRALEILARRLAE